MAYRQIGSVLLRAGTQTSHLTMVLNHTRASMLSNNPSPEEVLLLDSLLVAGEADHLLLLILPHGTHQRHSPDLLLAGEEEEVVVVVVDGADGVDHRWLALRWLVLRELRGAEEGEGEEAPILGLNRLPRLFLSQLVEVPQRL